LKRSLIVIGLILLVLIADQSLKIWVKTTMVPGDEILLIGEKGKLHFTENPGMAFGMQFGGNMGKILLSLFRIAAAFFIGSYLSKLLKRGANFGLICSIGLIFAGAVGNIIDSAFYGMIFDSSLPRYHPDLPAALAPFGQKASFMPKAGGYAPFLQGKVVDMFYFPLVSGTFPSWIPFWGGDDFLFFRPVFNIADAAISVGVGIILVFQKRFFPAEKKVKEATSGNQAGEVRPKDFQADQGSEEANP
jgi:signal peptidase II